MITKYSPLTTVRTDWFTAMAKACVAASKAAYNESTIVGDRTSAHVLIQKDFDRTIVAFRGTAEIRDWITDAQFLRETFYHGQVHAGFKAAVYDVFHQIRSELDDVNPDLPLYLTGHSLGGAESELCAAMLHYYGHTVRAVYTFGQPRVGDAAFALEYNVSELGPKTYRFINADDIVPRMPGVLMGYRHAGLPFFFSNFGGLEAKPKLWAMALSDAFGLWADWRVRHELSLLEDHHIDRYIEKVNAL